MSFINPVVRKSISEELLLAANEIAAKHGLTVKLAGGSYDEAVSTVKVEFTFPNLAKEKTERSAKLYAPMLGLPEDIIGRSYINRGRTYTVTGLNPNKPKNAVELKDDRGKEYQCSVAHIKVALRLF